MFGMGFMEILLVAVVAIIALGPDKLPSAMVDIAKMFKKFKGSLDDAKSSLDQELKISDMKAEATKFKAQFEDTKQSLKLENNLGFEEFGLKGDDLNLKGLLEDDLEDEKIEKKQVLEEKPKKKKTKKSALKTKKKKNLEENDNSQTTKVENENNDANKFKVNFDEEENKSENS